MATEFQTARDTVISGSNNEDRHVRYIDERIYMYAPSYAPLLLLKGGIMPGPNGERIKVKGIIDSGFVPAQTVEWYEKDLFDTDLYAAAANNSTSNTTMVVDNGAGAVSKVPRVGDIIEVVSDNVGGTAEQMFIQAITVGATTSSLTVVRNCSGSGPVTIADNAKFRVITNAQKENSSAITKKTRTADKSYNYMQIQRDEWGVSRTDDRIRLYGGRDKAETMAEAATNHCRLLERSLCFGGRKSTVDAAGNQVLVSGGLRYFIPNIYGASTSSGLFSGLTHGGTVDGFTEFLEVFCRYGFKYGNIRRRKIFIGGGVWGLIFNRLLTGTSPATGSLRATMKDTAMGVQVTQVISAFGTLDFLPSGAIDETVPTEAFLIDPELLKFCYIDNTFMVDNAQNPDVDGYAGYFLTEFSLKIQGLKAHSRISGVTGPA